MKPIFSPAALALATGLVLAKLVRDGDRWRAHAIGEGIAATVPSESVAKLRPFL